MLSLRAALRANLGSVSSLGRGFSSCASCAKDHLFLRLLLTFLLVVPCIDESFKTLSVSEDESGTLLLVMLLCRKSLFLAWRFGLERISWI